MADTDTKECCLCGEWWECVSTPNGWTCVICVDDKD